MTRHYTQEDYLSPFTWRYGSQEMRTLWSEGHRRRLWRKIWVALAEAQRQAGLVTQEQVDDLRAHAEDIDLERALQIEAEIRHDMMAEVHTFAEQCTVGGGIIHLGATSMDIQDNADALRLREALGLTVQKLRDLLGVVADQIETYAHTTTMAFTHLQPAEPTTIGYRLAQYGQDLAMDFELLSQTHRTIRGKGFKGATGTSASYHQLLEGNALSARGLESIIMDQLGIEAFEAATQVSPRKQEYTLLSQLAGLGQSVYRFAFVLRILQSPVIGEWAEPFGKRQVGSSAMPFKRNPIDAENIDSLARHLGALPRVAWDNAAHSLLERTLDDSANRRSLLPEAFLIVDELLRRTHKLMAGLQIRKQASARLMETYGPFAATERLLMEAVKRGGNRQELHEAIRNCSIEAWTAVQDGRENPLEQSLCQSPAFATLASPDEIRSWLCADDYIGDAPQRARAVAQILRQSIETSP